MNIADIIASLRRIKHPALPVPGLRRPWSIVNVATVAWIVLLPLCGLLMLLPRRADNLLAHQLFSVGIVLLLLCMPLALLLFLLAGWMIPLSDGELAFGITEEGLRQTIRGKVTVFAWSSVRDVEETPKHIFIQLSKYGVTTYLRRCFIPKRFFATPELRATFMAEVRAAIARARPLLPSV